MKSGLLKTLFQAYAHNDRDTFIEIANEIIRDEERKKHNLLALDLKNILEDFAQSNFNSSAFTKIYKSNIPIPRDAEKGFPLLEIKDQYFNMNDLIVDKDLKDNLNYIVIQINNSEILNTYGLKPKQKILFCGPPGTGKTLSSKVLSSIIGYPLVHIRFDSIISSYLGETATNLRRVFDFIDNGEWVVLFDEFDIIGKKRDDPYEHGEIKRVVNNFMQMMDNYNGRSLIIAATNHQYLLDSAIWRRFDEILYFDLPDQNRRSQIFNKYLRVLKRSGDIDVAILANLTKGFSPADIAQICEEALRKTIISGKEEINNEDIMWSINQQIRKRNIMKMI